MITASVNRIIFNGNGVATEFPYSFKVTGADDVKVMTVDPDGTGTVLSSDYFVDVENSKVIYPGYSPGEEPGESEQPPILPEGWQLVVYREIDITQESKLSEKWPFNVIEGGLDKLTMIAQVLNDGLARSFSVSEATPADVKMVVPVEAGKSFRWSDDGKSLVVTDDPAKVTPQVQSLLAQTKEQANNAANSALSAAQSETNAANSEDKAQAWAESDESPDGETDSESPTSETMSAKEWTLYAKQLALQIGNPVVKVTESNGIVTVEKSDGTTNTFKAGINMLGRNKTYAYGDIAYSSNLPSWAYLYCVQAGTTAASEPSFSSVNTMGQYITDGAVKWIVDDVRFNIPVGVPFYDTYLHDGCVKLNGATVNRADYIRPAKIATDKSLWTSSPSTEPYKYGNGNGSTTMTLPDYRNRVIQGGDTVSTLTAGLPEIYGTVSLLPMSMMNGVETSFSGAFKDSVAPSVVWTRTGSGQAELIGAGTLAFQASDYNAVYGKSSTVQPPALQLIPQIRF